jgi:hypothetical protein
MAMMFVRDDLGFYRRWSLVLLRDHLTPEQSPLKPLSRRTCLMTAAVPSGFQNGLELIAGDNSRKIEDLLHRSPFLLP